MPAAICEILPGRSFRHRAEQPKHLGVASWPVTPPEAITLDQVRLVLGIGVRDQEARRAALVPAHDIRCSGERQFCQLGKARCVTHGGEGVNDTQGAVRDVVEARLHSGAHLPVHAAPRRLARPHVWRDREDGKAGITGSKCTQCDAGIPAEQLELVTPSLPVEAGPDDLEGMIGGCSGGGVCEQVVDRVQGDGHPGEAGVQRTMAHLIDCSGDRPTAANGRVGVPVVGEMPVSLKKRGHDSRGTAVQGGIDLIGIG